MKSSTTILALATALALPLGVLAQSTSPSTTPSTNVNPVTNSTTTIPTTTTSTSTSSTNTGFSATSSSLIAPAPSALSTSTASSSAQTGTMNATNATGQASYTYNGTSTINNQTGEVVPVSAQQPTIIPAAAASSSMNLPANTQTPATAPAQTGMGALNSASLSMSLPPQVLEIDGAGNILVRGVVTSVGANSMIISSWGGSWTIMPSGAAQISPSASGLSGMQVGDFVGAAGTVQKGSMTVTAAAIRDWTQTGYTPSASNASASTTSSGTTLSPTQTNTKEMGSSTSTGTSSMAMPEGETLYTGTASNIGNNSFTLTGTDGTSYPVKVNPATTSLWNKAGSDINFTDIKDGDSIRLDGTVDASGNITPSVVRDTSL